MLIIRGPNEIMATINKIDIIKNNPHLQQMGDIIPVSATIPITIDDIDSSTDKMRAQYSTKHWGQGKLLFSEIQVLTDYVENDDLLVYIGAADGTHINILVGLFPMLQFYLCDPRRILVPTTNRITIAQELFNPDNFLEWVKGIKYNRLILFSDIRSVGPLDHPYNMRAAETIKDMRIQEEWVNKLRPAMALLKFKLPRDDQMEYLDGKLLLPILSRSRSRELRLLVTPVNGTYPTKMYDMSYNHRCYYYNNEVRTMYYEYNKTIPVLDHCHDCAMIQLILDNYLALYSKNWKVIMPGGIRLTSQLLFTVIISYMKKSSEFIRESNKEHLPTDEQIKKYITLSI